MESNLWAQPHRGNGIDGQARLQIKRAELVAAIVSEQRREKTAATAGQTRLFINGGRLAADLASSSRQEKRAEDPKKILGMFIDPQTAGDHAAAIRHNKNLGLLLGSGLVGGGIGLAATIARMMQYPETDELATGYSPSAPIKVTLPRRLPRGREEEEEEEEALDKAAGDKQAGIGTVVGTLIGMLRARRGEKLRGAGYGGGIGAATDVGAGLGGFAGAVGGGLAGAGLGGLAALATGDARVPYLDNPMGLGAGLGAGLGTGLGVVGGGVAGYDAGTAVASDVASGSRQGLPWGPAPEEEEEEEEELDKVAAAPNHQPYGMLSGDWNPLITYPGMIAGSYGSFHLVNSIGKYLAKKYRAFHRREELEDAEGEYEDAIREQFSEAVKQSAVSDDTPPDTGLLLSATFAGLSGHQEHYIKEAQGVQPGAAAADKFTRWLSDAFRAARDQSRDVGDAVGTAFGDARDKVEEVRAALVKDPTLGARKWVEETAWPAVRPYGGMYLGGLAALAAITGIPIAHWVYSKTRTKPKDRSAILEAMRRRKSEQARRKPAPLLLESGDTVEYDTEEEEDAVSVD